MTATDGAPPQRQLREFIAPKLYALQSGYLAASGRNARATATLARLRQFNPLAPAGNLTAAELILDGMPPALVGHGDAPSRAEIACALVFHLYAIHQQGKPRQMFVSGHSVGAASKALARDLGVGGELNPGVVRRYNQLSRATSMQMRLTHLRGLVRQLRGADLPLDYAALAADLYDLQAPAAVARVHLRWSRDFFASDAHEAETSTLQPASIETESL